MSSDAWTFKPCNKGTSAVSNNHLSETNFLQITAKPLIFVSFCSLSWVQQQVLLYLLADGNRVNRLWLGFCTAGVALLHFSTVRTSQQAVCLHELATVFLNNFCRCAPLPERSIFKYTSFKLKIREYTVSLLFMYLSEIYLTKLMLSILGLYLKIY